MKLRRILQRIDRLLRDRRGSADLNTYLLLTAAGATMVGLTAPHLFKSSKTASDTFEKQVEILQRGAGGGASSSSGGGGSSGGWDLSGMSGLGQFGSSGGGGSSLTSGSSSLASGSGTLASGASQLAQAGSGTIVTGTSGTGADSDKKTATATTDPSKVAGKAP